jgi:hypothetical protein
MLQALPNMACADGLAAPQVPGGALSAVCAATTSSGEHEKYDHTRNAQNRLLAQITRVLKTMLSSRGYSTRTASDDTVTQP